MVLPILLLAMVSPYQIQIFLSDGIVRKINSHSHRECQRGLGMLPQQANLRDLAEGQIEKMRKPVQVSTACQFVKTKNPPSILLVTYLLPKYRRNLSVKTQEFSYRYILC